MLLYRQRSRMHALLVAAMAMTAGIPLSGCNDDYFYDDEEPSQELLGASIYDYMRTQGDFTYFLRLVDDLGYRETLSRTGSKTLFPARDEAFERFFRNNPYGVSSYEELTPSQKRAIMNNSMVNMAYLSEMLSNIPSANGGASGKAIRHYSSASYLDSVTVVNDPELFSNPYWKRFNEKPLYLTYDPALVVHFTPDQMSAMEMSPEDFALVNGKEYETGEIYINGIKVETKDVMCKNGYIHVMSEVMMPVGSMADAIASNNDSKIFNKLLNKFSAPYYVAANNHDLKEFFNGSSDLRPSLAGVDSIFTKKFFNELSCYTGPNGESLTGYGMLYYDPSLSYYTGGSVQTDMGTMFVPTDEAMNEFFNGDRGLYLHDAYGSWENVPTDILAMFLKNHQKRSFVSSLPHLWSNLMDESSYPIDINKSNVVSSQLTGNGVVYFVNTVFPPIDYQGVYASVLTADNAKIMKWAITDNWNDLSDKEAMRFYMYLRSMENMYNLLVPTDKAMQAYREPISWARGGANRELWSFFVDERDGDVKANVYSSDENGNPGELKRTVETKSIIRNRLQDILDLHIIVGNNEDGNLSGYIDDGTASYVLTKGGGTIAVSGKADNLKVNGGGDKEIGEEYASVVRDSNGAVYRYNSDNGRTFFIDHMLHDATVNVYDMLGAHSEFKAFFDLCRVPDNIATMFSLEDEVEDIFSTKATTTTGGVGYVVNFFNNFRYTVLVPTEDALKKAFAEDPNLYTWDQILLDGNYSSQLAKTLYLLKFIRLHFVDNSAYITGAPYGPLSYETSARNEFDKFHKVTISSDGATLKVKSVDDPTGGEANVITSQGLYNLMARDLIVDNPDPSKATKIVASSRAVIHLIDRALRVK